MNTFVLIIDNGETEESSEHTTRAEAEETFQKRVKKGRIFDAQIQEIGPEGEVVRTFVPES
jgi:hypothetical protein